MGCFGLQVPPNVGGGMCGVMGCFGLQVSPNVGGCVD